MNDAENHVDTTGTEPEETGKPEHSAGTGDTENPGTGGTKQETESKTKEKPSGITQESVSQMIKSAFAEFAKQQKEAETGDITFKKSVKLSRECYILLRLARKIKAEEYKSYNNGTCYEFEVALDKEELKLFKEMFDGKVK